MRGWPEWRRRVLVVLAAVLVALVSSGCAFPVTGRAVPGPEVTSGADPSFIQGTDRGEDDRVAAAVLDDLQGFWGTTFPGLAGGRAFAPLAGYFSVDPRRPTGPMPPCLQRPQDIEGTAFYCPRTDTIAWDRSGLIPLLRHDFGDAAVIVVLAHEFGHSVQQRLDTSGALDRAPTILVEAQADCYAGVFLRQVRDGALPDLRTGASGVDRAMGALITFRDPVGTSAANAQAHGNAFDRVSSFQDGFSGTAATCAGMDTTNRSFTQQSFRSPQDESSGGNLALPELLDLIGPDLDRFYAGVVAPRGGRWTAPATDRGPATCGNGEDEVQGPVAWCATPTSTVHVDTGPGLADVHRRIGDFATGTLLASRYGTAALAALGRPTTGPDAGRAALCLAGAYSGNIGAGGTGFGLSPGDLDESVRLLLEDDDAARGTDGVPAAGTGYERIQIFRSGVTGGPDRCLSG
jgi:predicted metalloprotease